MLNAASVHLSCLSGRPCSQADVFLVSSSPLTVPPEATQQANANATQPSPSNKLLHGGSAHQSQSLAAHRVPFPTLHPPQENRTKKHQCVPRCMINVPSNLNPPALGRHRPAREEDVTHTLPLGGQAQLHNVQPNVGDRLNRPQRGDDSSDRLVSRPGRRPMEGRAAV
jgi:hypothetical protein